MKESISLKSKASANIQLNLSEEDTFELRRLENNLDDTDKFIEGRKNLIRKSKLLVVDKTKQFENVFRTYNYSPLFKRSSMALEKDLDRIINRPYNKFDEIKLKAIPKTPFVKLKQEEDNLKSCIKTNQFKESKKGIVLGLGRPMPTLMTNKKLFRKSYTKSTSTILQDDQLIPFNPVPLPGFFSNNLKKFIKNDKFPLYSQSTIKDTKYDCFSTRGESAAATATSASRPSTSVQYKQRPKSKVNKYSCILVTTQVDKLKKNYLHQRIKSASDVQKEFVNIVKSKEKRKEYMETFKHKPLVELVVAGDKYTKRVMSCNQGTSTRLVEDFFKTENIISIQSAATTRKAGERPFKHLIQKNILGSPVLNKHIDEDLKQLKTRLHSKEF